MIATEFTRYDCQIGKKCISYKKLLRGYRCNICGGKIVEFPPNGDVSEWHVACGKCHGVNFIHDYEMKRQELEAQEVVAGLPVELQEEIGKTAIRSQTRLFSLSPVELEI